jgi:hypothetical protein
MERWASGWDPLGFGVTPAPHRGKWMDSWKDKASRVNACLGQIVPDCSLTTHPWKVVVVPS